MKTLTLECEECGKTIKPNDDGLKCDVLYFCSQECLSDYFYWSARPIEASDFERDGEESDEESDEEAQKKETEQ